MDVLSPCAAVRNGQVTTRRCVCVCVSACVWLKNDWKMWTFPTRQMCVKMQKTERWHQSSHITHLDGLTAFKSRARIVLEKARRRFGVAACHRGRGGVCVYSNITELAVSEHTILPQRSARRRREPQPGRTLYYNMWAPSDESQKCLWKRFVLGYSCVIWG